MNSAGRMVIRILVAISLAAIVLAAMVAPALAQQGPQLGVTNFGGYSDQPDVAIDSQGNVHIVYFYSELGWWHPNYNYREIWYTMLDNNGNTLIDHTMISTDDGHNSVHPAIAIDSNDMVHIVWQDYDGDKIAYTKLDPNPAAGTVATLVDDITLVTAIFYGLHHPRIAVDSNDDIHIVWDDYYYGDICYMKIDNNGSELVSPTVIRDIPENGTWYSRPDVAVDSNDNPHITWNDNNSTMEYEIYYMMLRGSDGDTLIDATRITPDDGEKSKRQTIVVDGEDKVHIIWHDQRGSTEIYYTKLDPSLDDQGGDSADEGVITIINDTMLTADDGEKSRAPQSAIQCGSYIHITWYDDRDEGTDVYYMVLDTDGNIVVPETALTTLEDVTYSTSYGDNQPSLDVGSDGKAHTTWCGNRTGDYEIWYTTYQGPPCRTPPPVGGEAYPVNKASLLAPWIAVGVVLAGGISWYVLRRRRAQS